jgi:GTPase
MSETLKQGQSVKQCAVVGIVGRTNSGKSTLLNRMVGEKISIVSPVEQTTRNTIRGMLTEGRGQLVFLDEGALGTLLNRMARQASAGVDILAIVFDASVRPQLEDDGWMRRILTMDQPVVFVLNKNDMKPFFDREFKELWQTILAEKGQVREVCWISASALQVAGVVDLVDQLFSMALPCEEYLFPEDIVTDYPRKLAIADVVREKFLSRLHQELPHELGVRVDQIEETSQVWNVTVTLFVNRESQKGIVIGPKGQNLKYVRQCADPELSEIFGVKVKLELWVKVEKEWMKNTQLLRQMGYMGMM